MLRFQLADDLFEACNGFSLHCLCSFQEPGQRLRRPPLTNGYQHSLALGRKPPTGAGGWHGEVARASGDAAAGTGLAFGHHWPFENTCGDVIRTRGRCAARCTMTMAPHTAVARSSWAEATANGRIPIQVQQWPIGHALDEHHWKQF